jgi:hypothetical protein
MAFCHKTMILALAVTLALGFARDSFARIGGGFSFGSRGARTFSAPSATPQAPQGAAPIERSMTSPNENIFRRPSPYASGGFFSGGLGRGLLGGFIGAGLFGLLFGPWAFWRPRRRLVDPWSTAADWAFVPAVQIRHGFDARRPASCPRRRTWFCLWAGIGARIRARQRAHAGWFRRFWRRCGERAIRHETRSHSGGL